MENEPKAEKDETERATGLLCRRTRVEKHVLYVTRSHQTSINSQIPNAATARNSSGGQFGVVGCFFRIVFYKQ